MPEDNKYPNYIGRGNHGINDRMFDLLKTKVTGKFLDIGCNIGVLLFELPNGTGVDLAVEMVECAKEWGLDAHHADATDLPFEDGIFDTVVMSCLLEQVPDWEKALKEALRVSKVGGRVIGINPIPGESIWGEVGGTEWVKSVISEEDMEAYGAEIEYPEGIEGKYYFEIKKSL